MKPASRSMSSRAAASAASARSLPPWMAGSGCGTKKASGGPGPSGSSIPGGTSCGAAPLKQPTPHDLARRYTELLAENLGQPGFRELLIVVHDLDAHRDLVFALVGESRRRDLLRRPTTRDAENRRAELVDLSGLGR